MSERNKRNKDGTPEQSQDEGRPKSHRKKASKTSATGTAPSTHPHSTTTNPLSNLEYRDLLPPKPSYRPIAPPPMQQAEQSNPTINPWFPTAGQVRGDSTRQIQIGLGGYAGVPPTAFNPPLFNAADMSGVTPLEYRKDDPWSAFESSRQQWSRPPGETMAAAAPPSMYPPLEIDPPMSFGDDEQTEMPASRSKRKQWKRREEPDKEEKVTAMWELKVSSNLTLKDIFQLLKILEEFGDMSNDPSQWNQTMYKWRMRPGEKGRTAEELRTALDRIRPEFQSSAEFQAAIDSGGTVLRPLKELVATSAGPDSSQAGSKLTSVQASRARLDIVILREFQNLSATLEERITSSEEWQENYGGKKGPDFRAVVRREKDLRTGGVTIERLEKRLGVSTDQH